jgi:GDPmannose 4,6-dehydratase
MKKALITGVCGQDGSYLVDLLSAKGYEIHGINNPVRIGQYPKYLAHEKIKFHAVNIQSATEISEVIEKIKPDEIYHLASDVEPRVLPHEELFTFNGNFIPGMNILDAVLAHSIQTKVYVAGSSLMFGNVGMTKQNELTPMWPNTPYGIAKTALYNCISMYREVYGIFCVCGILYNHESPRRAPRFLPRKITQAAARIKLGLEDSLELGDIEIQRDWCYAGDVVHSMWLMTQNSAPRDYVVGSGELRSAKDILDIAFSYVDLDWKDFVVINKNLFRRVEYKSPCADPLLIKQELGWNITVGFHELIQNMVKNDLLEAGNAN